MGPSTKKYAAIYLLSIVAFAAALWGVLKAGQRMFGAAAGAGAPTAPFDPIDSLVHAFHDPVGRLLLQLLVIVGVARGMALLFRKLGQPAVIGEMFAGLMLGPSILGALSPEFTAFVFPAESMGALKLLSQIGVILFMFVVGMELDSQMVRGNAAPAVMVSHIGILFPFILGASTALFLYDDYAGGNTSFVAFCLFMGISMSITAFPVLARILQERRLATTALGTTAIACAAVDDVTAWCGLAFVVAITKSAGWVGAAWTVALSLATAFTVLVIVRPTLAYAMRSVRNPATPGPNITTLCLLTLFSCALATELIGIHALFGAFLAGVAMPKNPEFRHRLRERLEYFSSLFLLPIFFAFTGLRTQLNFFHDPKAIGVCAIIIGVAVLGKLGGGAAAARLTGQSWRDSLGLGVLMNTRGLMELIALNLAYDLGVLSAEIFAMLVVMALVTTFSTGPLLSLLGFRQGKTPSANPQTA